MPRRRSRWPLLVAATALFFLAPSLAMAKAKLTGKININEATAEQLTLLPGVGPVIAERIVDHRKHRPFDKPWEITHVKGVGAKLFRKLEGYIETKGSTTLKKSVPKRLVKKGRKGKGIQRAPGRRSQGPKIIDFRRASTWKATQLDDGEASK